MALAGAAGEGHYPTDHAGPTRGATKRATLPLPAGWGVQRRRHRTVRYSRAQVGVRSSVSCRSFQSRFGMNCVHLPELMYFSSGDGTCL